MAYILCSHPLIDFLVFALHHQYAEDARAGRTSAQGGERCRLIWNGIPIWHHLQLINYFEDKGTSFVREPFTSLNWGNKTATGRLDLGRPFHTLAEKYTNVYTNKPIATRFGYFDEAIRENPASADAWLAKCNELKALERYSDALECYTTALKIDPKSCQAWIAKGNTLVKVGRQEDALECFGTARKVSTRRK